MMSVVNKCTPDESVKSAIDRMWKVESRSNPDCDVRPKCAAAFGWDSVVPDPDNRDGPPLRVDNERKLERTDQRPCGERVKTIYNQQEYVTALSRMRRIANKAGLPLHCHILW